MLIDESGYYPEKVEVHVGTTVVFKNNGIETYWPASDNHPSHGQYDGTNLEEHCTQETGKSFDACAPINPGESWQFTFDKTGTFSYHDHLWPHFKGEVIVEDNAWVYQNFTKILIKLGLFQSEQLKIGVVSDSFYEDLKQKYQQIVLEGDPRQAILSLESESIKNPNVMSVCHDILHDIGHTAFAKYGNFTEAISYKSDFCNSGYIHGLFESYFLSTSDSTDEISKQCQSYADTSGREFDWWQCLHGVGHGFMYTTGGNLEESLALCEGSFERNAEYCQNGAYMEVFNQEMLANENLYVDPENPFATCNSSQTAKAECYVNLPPYLSQTNGMYFREMFNECEQADAGYVSICVLGVGAEAIKRNMDSPQLVVSLCEQAGSERRRGLCLRGMVSMYMNQTGSYEKGESLCELVPAAYKTKCSEWTLDRKDFFN